jgi:uncharacterized membrane protein YphA (DoxX/SURF4 family)
MNLAQTLTWTVRVFVGLLFLLAGLWKLHDLSSFSMHVSEFLAIGNVTISDLLAIVVSLVELILGTLLIFASDPRPPAVALSVLLLTFVCAGLINILRHRSMECGCLPFYQRSLGWEMVVGDLAIVAGLAVVVFVGKIDGSNGPHTPEPVPQDTPE